jgi:hypothetical protein
MIYYVLYGGGHQFACVSIFRSVRSPTNRCLYKIAHNTSAEKMRRYQAAFCARPGDGFAKSWQGLLSVRFAKWWV